MLGTMENVLRISPERNFWQHFLSLLKGSAIVPPITISAKPYYHSTMANTSNPMGEKRSGKDRRVNKDRRKGTVTSYSGPEKRAIKYQRTDKDRRKKDSASKTS